LTPPSSAPENSGILERACPDEELVVRGRLAGAEAQPPLVGIDLGDPGVDPLDPELLVEVRWHGEELLSGEFAHEVVGQRGAVVGRRGLVRVDRDAPVGVVATDVKGGGRPHRAVSDYRVRGHGRGAFVSLAGPTGGGPQVIVLFLRQTEGRRNGFQVFTKPTGPRIGLGPVVAAFRAPSSHSASLTTETESRTHPGACS